LAIARRLSLSRLKTPARKRWFHANQSPMAAALNGGKISCNVLGVIEKADRSLTKVD
jgi:hypothetical protein